MIWIYFRWGVWKNFRYRFKPNTHKTKRKPGAQKRKVIAARKLGLSNLPKQEKKMLDVSSAKYPMTAIGETVRVRVPDVDRARSDENMLATVIELTATNLYKLENKQGV